MNPRTQFNIVVAVLVVAVGLLTFSGLPISDMRASAAVWPSQPGVLFSAPTETGAISGHIFKADGVTVITDVLIRVHASGVSAGTSSLGTYASQTDGSYTISGLAPGTYKVQCNNNGVGNYISEYYNNKLSRDQADIITVVAGQTATGIDFALDVGGSISGHVFKEDGISVITDTIITVGAEGVSSGDAVVSQADGSYTISGLAPGTYKVQGNTKRVGGYVDKWYNNKYVWSQADTIVVSAGQAVTGIDFNLEAGGAVSGHVFKADGVSVITDVTIMVQAGRVSPAPGGLGVKVSKTDGSYTIAGLAPGTYKVWGNSNRTPNFIIEYYNNKLSGDQADLITVVAGQTVTGIDFSLEQAGAISGRVYEQDGVTPIANAHIMARGLGGNWDYHGYSAADGSYALAAMPSNSYEIKAELLGYALQWYHLKPGPGNADRVQVVAPQTTPGIDFALNPGGAIAGRVFKADGVTPVIDSSIYVCAIPTGSNLVDNCSGIQPSDGTYMIPGLTPNAPYKVRASDNNPAGYASEYYDNKTSWDTANTVTVTAKQVINGINFTLDRGGAISGHVFEQDGVTPVANACVNVSATAPQWNQIAGFCCTGSDGSFTITGVPVGHVYVRTHANCQNAHPDLSDEWYAAGGSTPDGNQASPVNVVAGQTTPEINFQLNRTSVVKGIIYNADATQPIPRAGIHYSPADKQGSYYSYCADENGRFLIPMPAGSYKFFARGDSRCGSDPNLAREYWPETAIWDQAEVITVTAEAPVVREITFTLSLGGSIWGNVHDATSLQPVGGALVQARSPDGLRISFVCANDDGTYVIPGLLLGDYKVYAGGGCRASSNYVAEYWQERSSFEFANIVTLSADNRERRGIDFTLLLGSRISGQIFRSDGITPVTDTPILITLYDAVSGVVQAQTQTWPRGGVYVFGAFPPGTFRLKAWDPSNSVYFAEFFDNKTDAAQADILSLVAGQTMSSVNFSLDRGTITEVPPARGATLVYTDTQALTTTVQVPALAVAKTTTLKYTEIMKASAPSGFAFAGHAFDLTAYQDGQPVSGLTFIKPVTVTLNYSDADVAGMGEATLQLNYWNGSAWSRDGITIIERDSVHNRLVATIAHLSKFAIFAEPRKLLYLPLITRRTP